MGIDTTDRLAEAIPLYIAVVVGLSLLVLLVVFRSIAVPVKATVGFLLSVDRDVRRHHRAVPVGLVPSS